jgi:predicted S18 family serine protease
MLEDARDERENGYPAAALFEALDAITRANLEIETIGVSDEDGYKEKIIRINNSASNSILKSIGFGVKPVLPVCYYEYGASLLEEDDLTYALFYYRFSGMIAGALSFTNISRGSLSSRYEGIPDYNPPSPRISIFSQLSFLAVVFILGGVAGLGLGLLIAGLMLKNKTEKPKVKEQEPTRKVYKSYASGRSSQRRYKYPNNEIPRSIRDYYKKKK